MKKIRTSFEQLFIARHLLYWTILVIPVAAIVGSVIAFFLWLLETATDYRLHHEWLLFLLPLSGIVIHYLYKLWGKRSEGGNNLIMDEIHKPGGGVPARMAPLVLFTTVITHFFGGSAGREGTAIQIGGSMASMLGKWFRLKEEDVRIILMAGVAAGFGAVFGTPLTGAVFALEVLAIGRIKYDALIPCLIAGMFADIVCRSWGIHHARYAVHYIDKGIFSISFIHFDLVLLTKAVIAGVAFGLAGNLFAELTHKIKDVSNLAIKKRKWLIPVIGGCIIIAMTFILGTYDYLGIGVKSLDPSGISIASAFSMGGATHFSWLWKLIFTAVTLGTGFKGGEVTPLFFIGATLGNTIAVLTGAPVDLFAGLGFIAVFAGATNTPIACTLMGVELFGAHNLLYYAVACFTAYYFSGHSGIYQSQRIAVSKFGPKKPLGEKSLKQFKQQKHDSNNKESYAG